MSQTTLNFDLLAAGGFPLKRFAENEKIFVKDDDGDCMYVVRSGRVGITVGGAVVETVGPNGMFGEIALIDREPRSATATAREPTELAVIDEKAFLYLVQKNPAFALDLMRKLAKRLRSMNESM